MTPPPGSQFGGNRFGAPRQDDPNKKWICGRLSVTGEPCPQGPSKRGYCQATRECSPAKIGGAWRCRRAPANGGPCEEGPGWRGRCPHKKPACKPQRTLRAQRETVARWAALLTVGILALTFAYSADTTLLMPGKLTAAHSALGKCSTCHTNVKDGKLGWLHSVIARTTPEKDAKACLTCHMMGEAALNPHGVRSSELTAMSKRLEGYLADISTPITASLRNTILPASNLTANGVYCATCHQEHQGQSFDLTTMTNDRCQSCHKVQFASFRSGHPKFEKYPFKRRTRIFFDHGKHFGEHFSEWTKKNPGTTAPPAICADCHNLSADNKHMGVKTFAEACSTCHIKQITGADRAQGPKGIAFFTLPGLDLETLKQKGINVGTWPKQAEGEMTPVMKLLIGWDDERRDMLRRVESLDLLDLTNASNDDLRMVQKFAWEVKYLFYALGTLTPSRVIARISASTGTKLDEHRLSELSSTLPRDVIATAQSQWLPKLKTEIEQGRRAGWTAWLQQNSFEEEALAAIRNERNLSPAPAPESAPMEATMEPPAVPSRQSPAEKKMETPKEDMAPPEERPTAPAPKIVRDKEEKPQAAPEAAAQPGPASEPPTKSGDQTDDLLIDEKDIPKGGNASLDNRDGSDDRSAGVMQIVTRQINAAAKGPIRLAQRLRINEFGEIVEEDEGPKARSTAPRRDEPAPVQPTPKPKTTTPQPAVEPAAKQTAEPPSREVKSAPVPLPAPAAPAPKQLPPPTPKAAKKVTPKAAAIKKIEKPRRNAPAKNLKTPVLDTENWAEFGGWYRQDYSINYKPTGHADRFLRAWLDVTGQAYTGADFDAASALFDELSHKDAQGQCNKCHSIDTSNSGHLQVNWKPSTLTTRSSAFTKFGHAPHLSLFDKNLCLTCHQMSDAKGQKKTYEGHDPSNFVSNFKQVDQTKCAECHTPSKAKDNCLLCHKYHKEPARTPIHSTKLPN